MAESKTARASMRAGMVGEVKKDPFDTPEKKIAELRKQREAKLFVVRMDFVDALLGAYDAVVRQNQVDLYAMKEISDARDEIVVQRNELQIQLEKEQATVAHLASSTSALLKRAENAEEQLNAARTGRDERPA